MLISKLLDKETWSTISDFWMGLKVFPVKPAEKPGTELKSSEMKFRVITDSIDAPYSRARGIWISSVYLCISFGIF